jgi:hypothetical protein
MPCQKKTVSCALPLLALLLLIQFVSVSSAQTTTGQEEFTGILPTWAPLMAVALFIGFGLAAIAYMVSSLFRIPELAVWAKTEVAEVTASAFLVAIILIALGFIDTSFIAVTGQTPMQTSISFTRDGASRLLTLYKQSVILSSGVGMLSVPLQYSVMGKNQEAQSAVNPAETKTTQKSTLPSRIGQKLNAFFLRFDFFQMNSLPFMSSNTILAYFGNVQGIALSATAISLAFEMLLSFINGVAIPVMLPLGVFLSAFTLTRKMGRTLIAFGIGLYLFVPTSVLMVKYMADSVYKAGKVPSEILEPSGAGLGSQLMAYGLSNAFLTSVLSVAIKSFQANGALNYQVMCAPVCALVAASCLIMYPACFAACFFPCFFVIQPFVVYPIGDTLAMYLLAIVQNTMPIAMLSGFLGVPEAGALSAVAALPGVTGNLAKIVAYYYLERGLSDKLIDVALDYTPYTMQLAVPFILLPLIVFLVTITAVRSISPAIGGEVQVLGIAELA